ncbi:MAG: DUF4384 domain-containing protein [Leptonema sp. (in: bacteria)]
MRFLCYLIFGFFFVNFLHSHPIAVMPFSYIEDNKQKGTNTKIANDIIAILKQQQRYDIVEQQKIEEIYNELQKGQTGLINQEDAAKLGNLKGIHFFIFGEIQNQNSNFYVNYRIVHTETGTIISAGRSSGAYEEVLDKISENIINQLDIYLNLNNPNSPYTVLLNLNKEKPVYKVNEALQLKIKIISHNKNAPKKVYLQLYSIDAKGKMTLIYPNKFSGFQSVEVDKEYVFPSENHDFEWILTPPIGTEYIQAFVTTQEIDLFNSFKKARNELFPNIDQDGNSIITVRGIQTQLKKDKYKYWSASRISYEIIE